jgi:hypothetical protein
VGHDRQIIAHKPEDGYVVSAAETRCALDQGQPLSRRVFSIAMTARRYFMSLSGSFQDLVGKGVHRRLGVSGVEFCDDHTRLPLLFIALPPVFGPLLRSLPLGSLLPGHLSS